MTFMKKIFYLIFALLMCSEMTARERSALKVTFTDGTTTTLCTNYSLSIGQYYDMETKSFVLSISHTDNDHPEDNVDSVTVEYVVEHVKSMQFVEMDTKVESLEAGDAGSSMPRFYLSGKRVTVVGANKSEVAAYSLDGKVPAVTIDGADGRVTLDFSSTQPGVYIVKTNAKPIKVRIQ